MKKSLLFFLVSFVLCLSSCVKQGTIVQNLDPDPDPPPAFQSEFASASTINQRLGRGINIGNMFNTPEGWDPTFDTLDLTRIANLGFKHLRLAIKWDRTDRTQTSPPYTIDSTFLNNIKAVVNKALQLKLHVIIDMHSHTALYDNYAAQKNKFLAQWTQVADAFKDYPDSLLFEVLNEPQNQITPSEWNTLFSEALTIIRSSNPRRVVLLGTAESGGLTAVNDLVIPNDEQLILTLHYYLPLRLTHQGADWLGSTEPMSWLGTQWFDTQYERDARTQNFAYALQFAAAHNIPVHIGEFGVIPDADMDSRVRWTRFMARWFEQQSFSWAYWEFNSGFGIYDPSTGQYRQQLADALLNDPMPAARPSTLNNLYTSDFSTGTDGWFVSNNLGDNAANITVSNNKLNVNFSPSAASEEWHIQLIKENLPVVAGKTYRFSFNAYSTATKKFSASMSMRSDPWSTLSDWEQVLIDETDRQYTFVFYATQTSANSGIILHLGKSGLLPITIHNIKYEEVDPN